MTRLAPLRVAIAGSSVAGASAGLLLRRLGCDVKVFEREPAPTDAGAGFLLQPTGLKVLHEMGLAEAVLRQGARVNCLIGNASSGRSVLDVCI